MYDSAAKLAFTSLFSYKLFGLNFVFHFTPIMCASVIRKLFPTIRAYRLLIYLSYLSYLYRIYWLRDREYGTACPRHCDNLTLNKDNLNV